MLAFNDIIKKLPNGKYRLYSRSGKNLGTYSSRAAAEKRERQVNWFKHNDADAFFCDAARPKGDPTGTGDIRRRFNAHAHKRFRALRQLLQIAIVKQDVLGLLPTTISPLAIAYQPGQRQIAFQSWFDGLLKSIVLEHDGAWLRPMIQIAYTRAVKRAIRLTRKPILPTEPEAASVNLAVLSTIELQGINEAVSQRVMRAVSLAYIDRLTPQQTFAAIDLAINQVGFARAKAMVALMTIKAFTQGTLDQFAAAGVQRVGLIPETVPTRLKDARRSGGPGSRSRTRDPSRSTQYRIRRVQRELERMQFVNVLTAGDSKVCPVCEEIEENNPYTIDEARSLIPAHLNCRCAFVALDNVPDDDELFEQEELDL